MFAFNIHQYTKASVIVIESLWDEKHSALCQVIGVDALKIRLIRCNSVQIQINEKNKGNLSKEKVTKNKAFNLKKPTVVNLDFGDFHFIIFYLSILWFNFIFMFTLAVSVKNIINSVTYKDLQYGNKSLAFSRTLV